MLRFKIADSSLVNILFNITNGYVKWLIRAFCEMCYYQVFVGTFMVMFSKIMNILPLIKKRWMAGLKLMHVVFSTSLFILGITTALLPNLDHNSE